MCDVNLKKYKFLLTRVYDTIEGGSNRFEIDCPTFVILFTDDKKYAKVYLQFQIAELFWFNWILYKLFSYAVLRSAKKPVLHDNRYIYGSL